MPWPTQIPALIIYGLYNLCSAIRILPVHYSYMYIYAATITVKALSLVHSFIEMFTSHEADSRPLVHCKVD
ncbi:uncharacterized protein H6S33_012752 [Morchella sextelata]|uniref:uncharacterized protein n=1 Tax=Morchella sextelata TaxID=1174677 RepID=UPI001D037F53|nr:uncharacterized protein H6S33_012752 [Morchella sextelata]KAH0609266.1 hypothetical protein H6S33_012752 [Morchella sextelata]